VDLGAGCNEGLGESESWIQALGAMRDRASQSHGSKRWVQQGIGRVEVVDPDVRHAEGSGESESWIQAQLRSCQGVWASQAPEPRWAQKGLVEFCAFLYPWIPQPEGLS
jgi:hypothetical protein